MDAAKNDTYYHNTRASRYCITERSGFFTYNIHDGSKLATFFKNQYNMNVSFNKMISPALSHTLITGKCKFMKVKSFFKSKRLEV